MILNLLRQSKTNPEISAWEAFNGVFSYNHTPLSPLGCRVLIHKKTGNRNSWDYWGKEGPKTNLSVQTKHFPNAFWLNGPQGVITNCATTTLDEVSRYIASIVSKMIREQKNTCEIKEEIQNAYCQTVYESSLIARKFYASCTPGYYSNEGSVDVTTKSFAATYPGGSPGQGGVPKFFQK